MSTSIPQTTWIDIAFARSPWSIRGHIKIHPLCDWDTLQTFQQWRWVSVDESIVRDLICVEKRFLDGKHPAIRFEGINDRTGAEGLKNGRFCVLQEALPSLKEDEYYWKDLMGLMVENHEGVLLGEVVSVQENLANVFMTINPIMHPSKKEFSIPFVDSYVMSVRLAEKKIIVDWPMDWLE